MHSVHDIVCELNKSLDLPGNGDIHGLGQTVLRKNDKLPAIVKRSGEAVYVGIDDNYSIRLYHKINAMATRIVPKTGVGRSPGSIANSYSMLMIVFMNRRKVNLFADELVLLIQSQFPDSLTLEPYQSINIFFNSVILNDVQVYTQEYTTEEYRLAPEHNLFQINYTLEATFKKDCFITCS